MFWTELPPVFGTWTKRNWRAREIIGAASGLEEQPLPGRQRQDLQAARGEPGVLGGLLGVRDRPSIIVEQDDPAGDDAIEENVQGGDLGGGVVQVHVDE